MPTTTPTISRTRRDTRAPTRRSVKRNPHLTRVHWLFVPHQCLPQPLADESQINLINSGGRKRKARLKALDSWGGERKRLRDCVGSLGRRIHGRAERRARLAKLQILSSVIIPMCFRRLCVDLGGEGVVAYSLGNFVANQSYFYNLFSSPAIPSDTAILEIEFPPRSSNASKPIRSGW